VFFVENRSNFALFKQHILLISVVVLRKSSCEIYTLLSLLKYDQNIVFGVVQNFFNNCVVQNSVKVSFTKFKVLNFLALGYLQQITTIVFQLCQAFICRFNLLI